MLAANHTTLRNDLRSYCDRVAELNEPLLVTRKEEKHVVLMSPDSFNRLEKAARNAEYLAKIEAGLAQISAGTCTPHELIEVEGE